MVTVPLTLSVLAGDVLILAWAAVMTWCLATAEKDRAMLRRLLGLKEDDE